MRVKIQIEHFGNHGLMRELILIFIRQHHSNALCSKHFNSEGTKIIFDHRVFTRLLATDKQMTHCLCLFPWSQLVSKFIF